MRYLIALTAVVVVACEGMTPSPFAPSTTEGQTVRAETPGEVYSESGEDEELSQAELDSLALTQANASRASTDAAYTSCTTIAVYRGRGGFFVDSDGGNNLMITTGGRGEVGRYSRQDPGDLVFLWYPISTTPDRITQMYLLASICYN